MRLARWYWALLGLWAAGYAAVSLMTGHFNLRTPIFLAAVFLVSAPLIGIPAFFALIAPFAALPFALRRTKISQGA
jgi:uncharacterized membrane protein YraQ (UPF0718 family)